MAPQSILSSMGNAPVKTIQKRLAFGVNIGLLPDLRSVHAPSPRQSWNNKIMASTMAPLSPPLHSHRYTQNLPHLVMPRLPQNLPTDAPQVGTSSRSAL